MGSLSHQLNYGLLGDNTPKMINTLPRFDDRFTGINIPDCRNQHHGSLKGVDIMESSVLSINGGGARGVMPCCGVNSSAVMGTRVLRKGEDTSTDFMNVPQGFAKSQNRGLAYDPTKPLNVQPMRPQNFCFPFQPSTEFKPAPFRISM